MEGLAQICVLASVAVVSCLVLRGTVPVLGTLVALCSCVGILCMTMVQLDPVISLLHTMRDLTGLSDSTTAPLFKAVGIGILTQICSAICHDAGEAALGKAVEFGGGVMTLAASVPLLSAVLSVLQEVLER